MPLSREMTAEILLRLRADGEGELERARQELARVKADVAALKEEFNSGVAGPDEFRKGISALATELRFFGGIVSEGEKMLLGLDAASVAAARAHQKLADEIATASERIGAFLRKEAEEAERASERQMQAEMRLREEYAEGLQRRLELEAEAAAREEQIALERMRTQDQAAEGAARASERIGAFLQKEATEAEQAEVREAEAMAGFAERHESLMAKMEADADRATVAEAEDFARLGERHEQVMQKMEQDAARAAVREEEEFARAVEQHEQSLAREQAATDATTIREAEDFARLAERHEQVMDKMAVDAAETAVREEEAFAREVERHEAYLARELAAEEAAHLRELDEFSRFATQHETIMLRMETDEIAAMHRETDELQAMDRRHKQIMDAWDHQTGQGVAGAQKFGYAVLMTSHAIQDLQYGFGAVLNNIPLMVTSMGGGMGLAGTIMTVGVGISVFGGQIKEAARNLAEFAGIDLGDWASPIKKGADSVEDLNAKLKAMTEKWWKIDVDYAGIHAAEKKIEKITKDLEAFKSIEEKTTTQQKSARAVSEAVSEYAGATDEQAGKENLVNIIRKVQEQRGEFFKGHSKFEALGNIDRGIAGAQQALDLGLSEDPNFHLGLIKGLKAKRAALVDEMTREQTGKIRDDVGQAARGISASIDRITAIYDANKDAFTTEDKARRIVPVDPTFRPALEQARGANIRATEAEEAAERQEEEARKNRAVRRGIRRDVAKREQSEEDIRTRELIASAKGGAIQDRAQAMLDQLREAGGEKKEGQEFRPMTREEQFQKVQEAVKGWLAEWFKAEGIAPPKDAPQAAVARQEAAVSQAAVALVNQAKAAMKAEGKGEETAAEKRARELAQGKGPVEAALIDPILKRIEREQSREAIGAGMKGQVSEALGGGPDADRAAEMILQRAIEKAFGMVEAKSELAPRDAAREVLEERTARLAEKTLALGKRMGRMEDQMRRREIAGRMQEDYGLTDAEAERIAPRVAALIDRGFDPVEAGEAAIRAAQESNRRAAGVPKPPKPKAATRKLRVVMPQSTVPPGPGTGHTEAIARPARVAHRRIPAPDIPRPATDREVPPISQRAIEEAALEDERRENRERVERHDEEWRRDMAETRARDAALLKSNAKRKLPRITAAEFEAQRDARRPRPPEPEAEAEPAPIETRIAPRIGRRPLDETPVPPPVAGAMPADRATPIRSPRPTIAEADAARLDRQHARQREAIAEQRRKEGEHAGANRIEFERHRDDQGVRDQERHQAFAPQFGGRVNAQRAMDDDRNAAMREQLGLPPVAPPERRRYDAPLIPNDALAPRMQPRPGAGAAAQAGPNLGPVEKTQAQALELAMETQKTQAISLEGQQRMQQQIQGLMMNQAMIQRQAAKTATFRPSLLSTLA